LQSFYFLEKATESFLGEWRAHRFLVASFYFASLCNGAFVVDFFSLIIM